MPPGGMLGHRIMLVFTNSASAQALHEAAISTHASAVVIKKVFVGACRKAT